MTQRSSFPPSISVVIPTYNRHASTTRAVKSALAQSLSPLEILIVDDGSIEPIAWMPEAETANESAIEVRVIRRDQNQGASAARRTGIQEARGDLIAFLDSDDLWEPGKLQAQVDMLAGRVPDDLTAIVCGWSAIPEAGGRASQRIPISSQSVLDFASGCWFSPGTTSVVPRRAFGIVGLPDPSLRRLEDLDWFLRLAMAGGRIVVAPIVGATISIGRRGRLKDINEAGRIILSKLDAISDAALSRDVGRCLNAYLDVERANAAYGEKKFLATAGYLGRSFARKPRLAIPLKPWWPAPHGIEEQRR